MRSQVASEVATTEAQPLIAQAQGRSSAWLTYGPTTPSFLGEHRRVPAARLWSKFAPAAKLSFISPLAGSGDPVQTNGLGFQARQRYASKAAVLCVQSQQGILAPLLVRELEESKYEVVAGARRLRAAKLAELEKLPVRVVKLTDAEAIEAQCVENLQREDIHPLEEALGFKSLLELGEPVYTIATIASRAGKSEAYVQGLCF